MNKGLESGRYKPLTEDGIGRIHEKALKILEEVGVRVESAQALSVFADSRAPVDEKNRLVRIPPKLVEAKLNEAPSQVLLFGRRPKNRLDLGRFRVHMGTGGAALQVIDPESGEHRKGTLLDIVNMARVADEMENIHFYIRPCTARDLPEENLGVNEFYAALSNTTKHVMGNAYCVGEVEKIIGMAAIIAGGREKLIKRPFLSFIVGWMKSPLTFDTARTEVLTEIVRQGMPVALSSAPMAGSTAPVTMAGTLCQLHAEELAGIVYTQLLKPGAPVLYGGIPGMADMQDLSYRAGGVEFGLMNAAISQLATYIDVPNYCSAGITEAHVPSFQAMYEKTFSISQCALAGSNYIHHAAGVLASIKTVDYGQMVIDNEIIGMALKMVKGIEVKEDTLAFEEIRGAGPGGSFMELPHTIKHMRTEYLQSGLTGKAASERNGGSGGYSYRDLLAESREKALKIIKKNAKTQISQQAARIIKEKYDVSPSLRSPGS